MKAGIKANETIMDISKQLKVSTEDIVTKVHGIKEEIEALKKCNDMIEIQLYGQRQ